MSPQDLETAQAMFALMLGTLCVAYVVIDFFHLGGDDE